MSDIGTLIAQFGIIPAIVCVLMYILIIWQQKRAERKKIEAESKKEQDKIAAEAKAAAEREQRDNERELKVLEMVKQIISESNNPVHTVEEQEEGRRINELINSQLDQLVEGGADRAYLFTFHNGGKDIVGRGFMKMSLTEESIGSNIKPIMPVYQNVPRALFPNIYKCLDNSQYYEILDVEKESTHDPMTCQFLLEHGASVAMFKAITREDGLMIGFIGMEYEKECQDIKKARRNINAKANQIIGALLGSKEINPLR